jgi:hypothetical protein
MAKAGSAGSLTRPGKRASNGQIGKVCRFQLFNLRRVPRQAHILAGGALWDLGVMLRKPWQPIAVTSFILLLLQEVAACQGVPKGATHTGKNRTVFRADAIGAVTRLGAFPRHCPPPPMRPKAPLGGRPRHDK